MVQAPNGTALPQFACTAAQMNSNTGVRRNKALRSDDPAVILMPRSADRTRDAPEIDYRKVSDRKVGTGGQGSVETKAAGGTGMNIAAQEQRA